MYRECLPPRRVEVLQAERRKPVSNPQQRRMWPAQEADFYERSNLEPGIEGVELEIMETHPLGPWGVSIHFLGLSLSDHPSKVGGRCASHDVRTHLWRDSARSAM